MSKKKNNNQLNPYHVDKFSTISPKFKIWFLKYWLAGAAFYLAILGIPSTNVDYLDRVVMLMIILALGLEYVGYTIILWMDRKELPTKMYLAHEIPRKKALSIFATLLYAIVITILILLTLELWVGILHLKTIGSIISDSEADPFTFGFLFIFYDYLWMKFRLFFKKIKGKKQ